MSLAPENDVRYVLKCSSVCAQSKSLPPGGRLRFGSDVMASPFGPGDAASRVRRFCRSE